MNVSSIQERLQLKREPLDKWSVREQLCLASAVSRSGDQNWMSVSRALKPFGDSNRPLDWFHQKNCAAQYGALLSHVETPKRKKRSGNETIMETPVECILRRLLSERQNQLRELLAEEKAEYNRLQDDMKQMQSGKLSEEQLDKWCKEIDEEESKREEETSNRVKWLKQRDLRKQEIERAWRLTKPSSVSLSSQKRKSPVDDFLEQEIGVSQYMNLQRPQKPSQFSAEIQQPPEPAKPALSPLLTSLLKSPSQVPISTSSILHTAITQQSNKLPEVSSSHSSPTITSLLHSSAISFTQNQSDDCSQPLNADILDDNNLKIDDLAKSILVQDGPFPEIKKEEVDDIISEIIENNHDIVSDPEQHLQLDGNGDININLELDELEQEETMKDASCPVKPEPPVEVPPVVDPFEFQEDPIMFESPVKTVKQEGQYLPLYQQSSPVKVEETDKVKATESAESRNNSLNPQSSFDVVTDKTVVEEVQKIASDCPINNDAAQYEENDTKPISTQENVSEKANVVEEDKECIAQTDAPADEQPALETQEELKSSCCELPKTDESSSETTNLSQSETVPEYEDDLYDNVNMEVKIDKTGKTKRDYSRTKKRDDKNFDMLIGIEKPHLDNDDFSDKKEPVMVPLMKVDNERSNSPWAEEEDGNLKKRRYSTPMDSMPNSPASSTAYDDDKDYRNWKKSMMLVYNRLASNKYASLFFKPITEEHAPGYRAIVYRPMDLQTIKKNIDTGVIRTSLEFKRDVMLMFTNAIMFNKTRDTVYNMALQMQKESMNPIDILLQADGQVEAPIRRETRTSESGCKRKRGGGVEESTKKRKKDE
ncbi:hypothetical protein HUJ04_004789 [Dendroctonus ponderosae]